MAINVPPRGGPPPGPPTGSTTSDHQGDPTYALRTALMALQMWLEGNKDDQDAHAVMKCVVALEGVLADHAKGRDAAMGINPGLQHVRRQAQATRY